MRNVSLAASVFLLASLNACAADVQPLTVGREDGDSTSSTKNTETSTQAPGASTATNPSGNPAPLGVEPTVQADCALTGGGGLELLRQTTARTECAAACTARAAEHPNLSCLWGAIDITPTNACTLTGGGGASISNDVEARGRCLELCMETSASRPNLSCLWGGIDITPTATCTLTGGGGAPILRDERSRGSCQTACDTTQDTRPNLTCKWGGIALTPQ